MSTSEVDPRAVSAVDGLPSVAGLLVRNRRVWAVGGALAMVYLWGFGAETSLARLIDVRSTTDAAVTSATIDVGLTGGATSTAWIRATSVGVGTGSATYRGLTITNTGTRRLRYSMTSTSTNATSPMISIDVSLIAEGTTCNASGYAAGTVISAAGSTLGAASATEVAVIGNKSTGAQGTDQYLAVSAVNRLCLRTYLLPGAGRSSQAVAGIASTFTFYSEQTVGT